MLNSKIMEMGGATKALILEVKYYRSFIGTLPNREERIELEKKNGI